MLALRLRVLLAFLGQEQGQELLHLLYGGQPDHLLSPDFGVGGERVVGAWLALPAARHAYIIIHSTLLNNNNP